MSVQTLSRRAVWRGAVTACAVCAAVFLPLPRPAQAEDAPVKTAAAVTTDTVIRIENFTFNPATLTVPLGATVTFDNNDDIPHTIVSIPLKARSKPLDTGDKYSFTFTTAGSFEYFCGLHPHMKGMVTVTP